VLQNIAADVSVSRRDNDHDKQELNSHPIGLDPTESLASSASDMQQVDLGQPSQWGSKAHVFMTLVLWQM
jgi:hypothetical protein